MRAAIRFAVAALLVAGCGSSKVDDGYAIDLNVVADGSIDSATLASAAMLDLEVTGDETYSNSAIAIAGKFSPTTRTAGLRYKPKATAGSISISITILDGNSMVLATGSLPSVSLGGGTQVLTLTLSAGGGGGDMAGAGDMAGGGGDMTMCGNGVVDPGEQCDPGPGSPKPCPTSVADCDDKNPCTTDALGSGTGCQASCTHTPLMNGTGCMMGTTTGVCQSASCCTGCVKNGMCLAGSSDAKNCGSGGNACFDCTVNSASATCNSGNCSGCDATSCTSEGRSCGTSSCGYNCGGCPDACTGSGTITHYACSATTKTCQSNGGGNCGLYAACASGTTCASSCTGDNGCVATAWCGSSTCKPKVGLGGVCSKEVTGDHECASPNVCSWDYNAGNGYCTSTRCTGCAAALADGSCNGFIGYGYDPRGACQSYSPTTCHQNYCGGQDDPQMPSPPHCDDGLDANHYEWRSCTNYVCTPNAQGVGVLSGPTCFPTNQCTAGNPTQNCADFTGRSCYPCNAARNGCDWSNQLPVTGC